MSPHWRSRNRAACVVSAYGRSTVTGSELPGAMIVQNHFSQNSVLVRGVASGAYVRSFSRCTRSSVVVTGTGFAPGFSEPSAVAMRSGVPSVVSPAATNVR
ncbi:MAG: hypothetical protein IPJ04_12220 [Candidatus Eisenbacteria bacterium]|nr:hypothetical protein [Candidatus Eisenbacteria bacterium]